MATSTQDMVRPGECIDLYYYDAETNKKQCFPTTQNTKFRQNFQSLLAGSSVFTIPPNQGVQDVVLNFQYNNPGAGVIAIPRGWAYALIKQVSFRYGGSSQYFLTGDQILQNALRAQPNRSAVNDLLTLGGQYYDQATVPTIQAANLVGSVVLTLPHSKPSGVGKTHPLSSDLLTQQIQITVELNDPASIFTTGAGGVAPALSLAQFVVQQVLFNNMGDALARRVDMSTNAYAFPCEFVQQKQTLTGVITNNLTPSEIVLTGFRSGEVKSLQVWLTKATDLTAGNISPFKWYLPQSIQMTYAGDIYARYDGASSPLWNLINSNKAPVVDTLSVDAAPNNNATPFPSQWVELPFAQTFVDEDAHYVLTHGKPITNGIINLTIVPPFAAADWIVNVSYVYNATLLFSQGTCDYVF